MTESSMLLQLATRSNEWMMNTEVVRWGFMALARVTTFDEMHSKTSNAAEISPGLALDRLGSSNDTNYW
jgi:hypothetical protein